MSRDEVNLEGKTPSNGRREDPAALPPLLGRGMQPRPATKGATPPWNPLERFPAASRGACEPLVQRDFLNGFIDHLDLFEPAEIA